MSHASLNPADEFESVLIEMAEIHRAKSQHYGSDEDPLWNFYHGAHTTGTTPLRQAWYLMAKHVSSFTNWLRKDAPANDYSEDATKDMCVYAVIVRMLYKRQT